MPKRSNDAQAKIQTAAKILFSSNGYKETKILDIAKSAKVSLGTIYAYYPNKRALFDSLDIPKMENARPEYEKKREDVIRKALFLFGEKGYEGTTMGDIASAIGVSKATVYQYCASKEDLFAQVLQESTLNAASMNLKRFYPQKNWEQALHDIGMSYLRICDDPERISLLRSVIAGSGRFPEIGALYYERGPKSAADSISKYLKDVAADGYIRNVDIDLAVSSYLGVLFSYIILYRVISGIPKRFSENEYVKLVTDIFINGLKNM